MSAWDLKLHDIPYVDGYLSMMLMITLYILLSSGFAL